jgi:hypothetical protein
MKETDLQIHDKSNFDKRCQYLNVKSFLSRKDAETTGHP